MTDKKGKRKLSRKRHAPSNGTANVTLPNSSVPHEELRKPNETATTDLVDPILQRSVRDATKGSVSILSPVSLEIPVNDPTPATKKSKRTISETVKTEKQTETTSLTEPVGIEDSDVTLPSQDDRKRVRKRRRVANPSKVHNATVDKVKVEISATPLKKSTPVQCLDYAIEQVLKTAAKNTVQQVGGSKKQKCLQSHLDRIIELTNQRIKEVMDAREPNIKTETSVEENRSPVKESSESNRLAVEGKRRTTAENQIPGDEKLKSMCGHPTQHTFDITDVEKLHPKIQGLISSENKFDNTVLNDLPLDQDTTPIVRDAAFSQVKKRLGIGLARAEVSTRGSEELVSRVIRGAWLVLERCVSSEERAEIQRASGVR